MKVRIVRFDRAHPLPAQSPKRREYMQQYHKRYLLANRAKVQAYRKAYYQKYRNRLIARAVRNKRKARKRDASQ